MKKKGALLFILVFILTVTACSTGPSTTPPPSSEKPLENASLSSPPVVDQSGSLNTATAPPTPAAASQVLSWYYNPAKNHQTPTIPKEASNLLGDYHGIWLLPNNEKRIYLTFDEGYELGYTEQILNVLKANQVKAAFFITGQYVKTQPSLVQRMKGEGHLVCSHTQNHKDMSKLSKEEIVSEITLLEKEVLSRTGVTLDKYLRPPMGCYSDLSLAVALEQGYRSVFWSMAYEDWDPAKQPGAEKSYQFVTRNVHPGAVILLHAVSASNTEALDRILKELKQQGYVFSTF
ncbi:MAG: polysaccharide deacetylase family protein [Syntrophomonadaceae bacterium]